ncbi:putative ribosome-recycling factor, mitochondrial [Aphelenchoides fujianensis]|nr:putative ribosome-recycling factor, mitochondrial [Aphelenchoides fujianensis]
MISARLGRLLGAAAKRATGGWTVGLAARSSLPTSQRFSAPSAVISKQSRAFSVTPTALKVHKKTEKEKALVREEPLTSDHSLLKAAYDEMAALERRLEDELSRHFSLQTDLRSYEEIPVKLKDGTIHRLNHLARITMKNAQTIMVAFGENAGAIGPARDAITRSPLNVVPQQDGAVLHIQIPRMSKERREALANDAKVKLFNEYKDALNKLYTQYDKRNQKETKAQDQRNALQTKLLAQKKIYEHNAQVMIAQRSEKLFKEAI